VPVLFWSATLHSRRRKTRCSTASGPSKEHGEELDRRVRERTAPFVREAEDKLARALEEPVESELEQHWESLGGELPD
jgi:hypothetical protein